MADLKDNSEVNEFTTAIQKDLKVELREQYQTVCEELAKLDKFERSEPKTNGRFSYNQQASIGKFLDINVETRIEKLISILGFLYNKSSEYAKGAEIAMLASYPIFKWEGYTYDDWKNDIELRIHIVTEHERKTEMVEMKKELESYFSREDRLSLFLEKSKKRILPSRKDSK